jgi:hypothetical protein
MSPNVIGVENNEPKWLLDLVSGSTLRTIRIFGPHELHNAIRTNVTQIIEERINQYVRNGIQI